MRNICYESSNRWELCFTCLNNSDDDTEQTKSTTKNLDDKNLDEC